MDSKITKRDAVNTFKVSSCPFTVIGRGQHPIYLRICMVSVRSVRYRMTGRGGGFRPAPHHPSSVIRYGRPHSPLKRERKKAQ